MGFAILFTCLFSIGVAVRSFFIKRKADFVADSNKLFYAVQKEKLEEEKRLLEMERIEAERHIKSKAKQENLQIKNIVNKNEVTLYEIKESAMLLADYHDKFQMMVSEFTQSRDLDYNKLNQLIMQSLHYRGSIEHRFASWFGTTIDEYKKAKVKLN